MVSIKTIDFDETIKRKEENTFVANGQTIFLELVLTWARHFSLEVYTVELAWKVEIEEKWLLYNYGYPQYRCALNFVDVLWPNLGWRESFIFKAISCYHTCRGAHPNSSIHFFSVVVLLVSVTTPLHSRLTVVLVCNG